MILTRQDLSDAQNLTDCRAELNRILDMSDLMQRMGAFAIWGAKWGEAMIERLNCIPSDREEIREAEKAADEFETDASFLRTAIEIAAEDMHAAAEMKSEPRAAAYEKIAENLEKALAQ